MLGDAHRHTPLVSVKPDLAQVRQRAVVSAHVAHEVGQVAQTEFTFDYPATQPHV
jgi:hypothetical protein